MSASEANWRPFWERIEKIFDPARPARDPALFAQRLPKYNSLLRLQRRLRRGGRGTDGQYSRYLVAGTVGNGKTSELYQLASRLADDRMVIYVDLFRHFEQTVGDPAAIDRLESWELLGLLGLVIVRAGADRFGHEWGEELKRLGLAIDKLRKSDAGDDASFDLVKLARGIVVAAGGVAGAVLGGPVAGVIAAKIGDTATEAGLAVVKAAADATDWKWQIGLPGRKQRRDGEPEVKALVQAVNSLIMALQSAYARRLVLVVDGIDRVREERRMQSLFVDSSLLAELVCDAVVTGPEFMLHGLSQSVRDFRPVELCNVPVLDRSDPTRVGPGLGFFRELVDKRVAAVAQQSRPHSELLPDNPFPDEVVERLAYYSGGVVRDFIKMAHTAAGEAWEANAPSISLAMVDEVLDEFRGAKQSRMTVGEIELLRSVMVDPNHGLPSDPAAFELLRQQRLLPYPNENPWYYPHPLLTLSLLRPAPGSAS
ncbi:MAG: hypothetical protein R6X02_29550 [Enhygromyxa sp.]